MALSVLHCPTTVGGNPQHLARVERSLGLKSHCVAFVQSPYNYPVDEVLWDDRAGAVAQQLERWKLLRRARREFDVVHYNFGSSILPWSTPALTKRLSRRVTYRVYGRLCAWTERRA